MQVLPDPAIASILGSSGLDYVLLDHELGFFSRSSTRACVEALQSTPAGIFARTSSAEETEIRDLVEAGVEGIQVPLIGSAAEAESVVAAARAGGREDVAVIAMIESAEGLERAAEITAVPGVDGICIGPGHLALGLGLAGEPPDHPTVARAIDEIIATTLSAGLRICAPGRDSDHRDLSLNLCMHDAFTFAGAVKSALEHSGATLDEAGLDAAVRATINTAHASSEDQR
jgi:4-hydroxy-2-oxoheptanedioate aldolase